jgi:hypothetical protein
MVLIGIGGVARIQEGRFPRVIRNSIPNSSGTWNWAWYCNKDVEKLVEEADAMVRSDQGAARIGGMANLFVDPIHIPVHYDEVRVIGK